MIDSKKERRKALSFFAKSDLGYTKRKAYKRFANFPKNLAPLGTRYALRLNLYLPQKHIRRVYRWQFASSLPSSISSAVVPCEIHGI